MPGGGNGSNIFKPIQVILNDFKSLKINRLKKDFPKLEKFEIKYGFEGFEEGNNFLHRNVLRF
jgi:hypothetical protein